MAQRKALLDEVTAEKTAASHAEREIERLRAEVATTGKVKPPIFWIPYFQRNFKQAVKMKMVMKNSLDLKD